MTSDEVLGEVVVQLKATGVSLESVFLREKLRHEVTTAYRNALDRYQQYAVGADEDSEPKVRVGSARPSPGGGWMLHICVRGRSEALVTVYYP